MANYKVTLSRKAQKYLDKLPDNIAEPIITMVASLKGNPRPHGYKKLTGRDGYWIRVGNYRVIYEIFDKILVVEVIDLGHRKEIYG
jgi:mRNA interferase RelE/StbE